MPVLTRLQARSAQPADLVTSPREEGIHPGRLSDSRQGKAVVVSESDVGGPSTGTANGNHSTERFETIFCKDRRCKACPKLSPSKTLISNITHKQYNIINHTGGNLHCHMQNIIYLLSCEGCNMQYVGETTVPLHKRINIHRTSKSGCTNIITHKKEFCPKSEFRIQIIEAFTGSGYNEFNEVDDSMRAHRLKREEHWIKILRTIYPYGLNERLRCLDSSKKQNESIGKIYPPLPRHGPTQRRNHSNQNIRPSSITCNIFFEKIDNLLENDLQNSMYHIRLILNMTRKKVLKQIASFILDNPPPENNRNIHIHAYILDMIDTKLYKPLGLNTNHKKLPPKNICTVRFDNKGMEHIRLSKIINDKNIVKLLPEKIQEQSHIPVVTFKLCNTIRNKILNYKQTVESIFIDEEVSFSTDTDRCDCQNSKFCDPDHGHIITGDLRIVECSKLRKLLTHGPNYREPQSLNYNKCKKSIELAIENCINKLAEKYKVNKSLLDSWKNAIKERIENKIKTLKTQKVPHKTNPTLADRNVIESLEKLHKTFVIVTIDKAANNFAFICKQYYISSLLNEVGIINNDSETYEKCSMTKEEVISNNIEFCNRFSLNLEEDQNTLPTMYWLPKMHKTPIGKRFIVASSKCSTKPLSKLISKVFKLMFTQTQNFHLKSTFYSHYKRFWVVQNAMPIIDKLNSINKRKAGKCISTFDFSTLYTKIPHDKLLETLFKLIDFVFNGGEKKYLDFSRHELIWTNKKNGKTFFTPATLKAAVKYLILECHFTVGNTVFTQIIGIPMGIDPAPFWANLHLYSYESDFILKLIKCDKARALRYHSIARFIDDLSAINDGYDFERSFQEIYPPELELKVEHHGTHATFLDLDITLKDGIFIYKLFDKRDAFPFFIVRMPNKSSNIPSTTFYGAIMSEFLRIARNTLLYTDFLPRARDLYKRMLSQGGNQYTILKQISKATTRHPEAFSNFPVNAINRDIAEIGVT